MKAVSLRLYFDHVIAVGMYHTSFKPEHSALFTIKSNVELLKSKTHIIV